MATRRKYELRYGYVDRTCKQIFPCKFEEAGKFVDGLAPVIHHNQPGFINRAGEMVIRLPKGAHPRPFSDGLALIYLRQAQEDLCGFIDRTGQFVIGPRKMHANPFNDGLALITFENDLDFSQLDPQNPTDLAKVISWSEQPDQPAYINKQGEIVFLPQASMLPGGRNDDELCYAEGLIKMKRRNKIGYVDLTGNFVIPPRFLNGGAFSEGLARVEVSKGRGKYRLAFIDHTGQIVIDTDINTDRDLELYSTNFSEGWAGFTEGPYPNVVKTPHTWGFIDRTGKVVLETPHFNAGPFREGLAAVQNEANKWGSIDKTGTLVIPFEYDSVGEFSDGLAVVSKLVKVDAKDELAYEEPSQRAEELEERMHYTVEFIRAEHPAKKRRKKKRQ